MKDKRTYTNIKEYGEDMSHENETKITTEPKEDRGSGDLTLMNEIYQKEIWEWKQRESEYIQTKNLLEGAKKIINTMNRTIQNLEHDNKTYKAEIEKLLAEKNK